MAVFSWLQETLEKHQQGDCETTPAAKKIVQAYDDQIENSKRLLRQRQEQERQERTSGTKR
jgi:hypothetical protein